MKVIQIIKQHNELLMWCCALLFLWILPFSNANSFCVLKQLGISFCPGCGIGRSIHLAMHGQWIDSMNMHKMGIVALILIIYRIFQIILFKNKILKPIKK